MREHVDTLGWLFIAYGALQLLVAVGIGLLFLGLGGGLAVFGGSMGDTEMLVMGSVYGVIGSVAGVVAAIFAVPNVLVGGALRRRAAWGRIGGFILGALALTHMPLGTMLGVFAFVVLADKEVAEEFTG